MNFNKVNNKKEYYTSINEMRLDHRRCNIIESYKEMFDNIKQKMFDNWNVENIYLIGELLEKNKFNTDNVTLFIEIKKDMFENMIDAFYINENKLINYVFNVDDSIWEYKDNKWINEGIVPIFKLLL